MANIIHARYSLRRATAAAWTSSNEILGAGEVGLETDTGRTKVGDGTTGWNALNYGVSGAVSGLSSIADGQGLKWDAASGLFVPGDLGKVYQAGAGISIGNPASATPTISGSGIGLSGRVATYNALPAQPVPPGAAYLCDADGLVYVSSGSAWPTQGAGIAVGTPDTVVLAAPANVSATGVSITTVATAPIAAGVYKYTYHLFMSPSDANGLFRNYIMSSNGMSASGVSENTYSSQSSGASYYQYQQQFTIPANGTSAALGRPGSAPSGLTIAFGSGALIVTAGGNISIGSSQTNASGTLTVLAGSNLVLTRLA